MKKMLMMTIAATILTATATLAQNTTTDTQIPMQYLEINQKCETKEINQYNDCLKKALMDIMSTNFTEDQLKDLNAQLDSIEKQVADAELDYENPKVKAIEGNEEKIKEFRAENMNLIWKRLLIETINSLNKAMEEIKSEEI